MIIFTCEAKSDPNRLIDSKNDQGKCYWGMSQYNAKVPPLSRLIRYLKGGIIQSHTTIAKKCFAHCDPPRSEWWLPHWTSGLENWRPLRGRKRTIPKQNTCTLDIQNDRVLEASCLGKGTMTETQSGCFSQTDSHYKHNTIMRMVECTLRYDSDA